MNDYDLLKKAHNNLPAKYKEAMGVSLKNYAAYLVEGGKEQDDQAKRLFRLYWVMYKIYHYQQIDKYYEFWDVMKESYEDQRKLALKICEER